MLPHFNNTCLHLTNGRQGSDQHLEKALPQTQHIWLTEGKIKTFSHVMLNIFSSVVTVILCGVVLGLTI